MGYVFSKSKGTYFYNIEGKFTKRGYTDKESIKDRDTLTGGKNSGIYLQPE